MLKIWVSRLFDAENLIIADRESTNFTALGFSVSLAEIFQ